MKPIIYFITAALVLVTGCHKSETAPSQEQYDRYIFFSQGIDTKASLINSAADMAGKEFAVIGFEYDKSSNWSTEKANALPNVFYNDAGTATIPVETLTCDNEGTNASTIAAEYSPLQGWSNTKKYSFFAYYPNSIGNSYVSLVNMNGTAYTPGAPSIKYTMNPAALKASMVDLMTASPQVDLDGSSSVVTSKDVTFNFSHRLSCLGLKVRNSSDGGTLLSSVVFHVSGIKYKEIVIPLDGSGVNKTAENSSISADLGFTLSDEESLLSSPDELVISDKLIFIPQTEVITIKVEIHYTRIPVNGYDGYEDTFESQELVTPLTEGNKHLVQINFTDSKVDVNSVVATEGWVEMPPVNDTFN